jgi:hypothetical protein
MVQINFNFYRECFLPRKFVIKIISSSFWPQGQYVKGCEGMVTFILIFVALVVKILLSA